MGKPVHSMIRVLDEKKSLDFYNRAFGLDIADHLKFDSFALIYLQHPSSPFEVELTVNFDRKEPYELGDGYGHLASSLSRTPTATRSK
jgi:lactoylglutathione lyase